MNIRSCLLVLAAGSLSAHAASVDFSTLIGGSDYDIPTAIATGADGSIYVTGLSGSRDFAGAVHLGSGDGAFVMKISSDGRTANYTAVIGGVFPRAVAVDASGQAYVAGYSYYNGLPVTNAVQPARASDYDAVLLKLNSTGDQVLFATYFGGTADDAALGVALNSNGDIWITGLTFSGDLPTANPFQAARAAESDGFLAEFSNDGSTLKFSTYFGGADGSTQARSLAIDKLDRPIIVGRTSASQLPTKNPLQTARKGASDVFVTKFEGNGQALVFSTFFGGSAGDSAVSIALDDAQNIFVHGITQSNDFPTKNAFQSDYRGDRDIFLTKLTPAADAIVYSTYLGGSIANAYRGFPNIFGDSEVTIDVGGVAVTPSGRAMIVGGTYSADFPTAHAIKSQNAAYSTDGVAALFEADGTVAFSTYLGGAGSNDLADCVAATPDAAFVIAGNTYRGARQPDFPVTSGALQTIAATESGDGFVVRLSTSAPVLSNDAFASPALLEGSRATIFTQTDAATREPNEAPLAPEASGKTAWYRWTAPATGHAILTASGNFATTLGVFKGASVDSLTVAVVERVTVNSDLSVEARVAVTSGETLQIAVDGLNGSAGAVSLSVILSLPPNDDFADRRILSGAVVSDTGSNVGATTELGEPWPHSIWWQWSTPVAGAYTITTVGSDVDTAMAVYLGAAGPDAEAQFTNGSYTNNLARLTFQADANVDYRIVVFGDYGAVGTVQLNIAPAVRPPNDDFSNRILLTQRNEDVVGTDFDSVYDPADWNLERLVEFPFLSSHIVWWQWTAPIDGAATISTVGTFRTAYPTDLPPTSLIIFEGDQIPTTKEALIAVADPNIRSQASAFLPTIRAGTHYQIGVDVNDWEQPAEIHLKIRAIAPPRIIGGSAHFDNFGHFAASVEGIEGNNYRVTTSTDLKVWTTVAEFPNITGQFNFEAPAAGAAAFFRIEEF